MALEEEVRRIEIRFGYDETRTEYINRPEDQQYDHYPYHCLGVVTPKLFALIFGGRIIFCDELSSLDSQLITSNRLIIAKVYSQSNQIATKINSLDHQVVLMNF